MFSKIWLEHSLYKKILCDLTQESKCERQFSENIKLLSWGQFNHHKIKISLDSKKYKTAEGELLWCQTGFLLIHKGCQNIQINMTVKEKKWQDFQPLRP